MIPVAIVVPEPRIAGSLAPIIHAARRRGIQIVEGPSVDAGWYKVVVGLDGFVTHRARTRIAVDNFFDCWQRPPDPTQIMCYASDFHHEQHRALWKKPLGRYAVVGSLWAPTPEEPRSRHVAVFFTAKARACDERRRLWWRLAYYRAFRQAVVEARRQSLDLLIKSREKHHDPVWLRWRSRRTRVGASSDLLRRSRWCVHFGSAAALEAAWAGTFAYWQPAPETHLAGLLGWDQRPQMFAYPGVSRIGAPAEHRVDPVAREHYVAKYLGDCDGKAAERVLDLAESLA